MYPSIIFQRIMKSELLGQELMKKFGVNLEIQGLPVFREVKPLSHQK